MQDTPNSVVITITWSASQRTFIVTKVTREDRKREKWPTPLGACERAVQLRNLHPSTVRKFVHIEIVGDDAKRKIAAARCDTFAFTK